MHVDLMRRLSGNVICEPAAISGEAAFARASGRYGRAQLAETPDTGSIAMHRYPRSATGLPTDRPDAHGRRLPSAVAGED
jgi:hypothetical protein